MDNHWQEVWSLPSLPSSLRMFQGTGDWHAFLTASFVNRWMPWTSDQPCLSLAHDANSPMTSRMYNPHSVLRTIRLLLLFFFTFSVRKFSLSSRLPALNSYLVLFVQEESWSETDITGENSNSNEDSRRPQDVTLQTRTVLWESDLSSYWIFPCKVVLCLFKQVQMEARVDIWMSCPQFLAHVIFWDLIMHWTWSLTFQPDSSTHLHSFPLGLHNSDVYARAWIQMLVFVF